MTSAKPQSGVRLIRPFSEQPTVGRVFGVVVGPALLGAASGWVLGLSAAGYWALQVVATIGGFVAGLEHGDARSGAMRGVVGGAIFGSSILLVRALADRADHVSLGSTPGLLPVITVIAGAILGALGGWRSRIG
jgi:hypothetical protein